MRSTGCAAGFGGVPSIIKGKLTGLAGKKCALVRIMGDWASETYTFLIKPCWLSIVGDSLRTPKALAKVLRGKYFHDGNFLKEKEGNSPSLTWTSILWGIDLFVEGYRWRVGDGERIYISQDPWIGREGRNKPLWVHPDWHLKRVNDLLNPNGSWNKDLLDEVFLPEDAKEVARIPRIRSGAKDEIIWKLEDKGSFSVKSAYHLAKRLSVKGEASGSNDAISKALWKSIWKATCIPRAKITVWKILNDAIPSKLNIAKRGINSNLCCCL